MQDYNEDDFLLLSGIQHFLFCKRQWALIHLEQQWEDNVLTVEGEHVHRVADQPMIREKQTKTSLLTQERGLKLAGGRPAGACDQSLLTQECGLKPEEHNYQHHEQRRRSLSKSVD